MKRARSNNDYDIIIAGAGASGLTLAYLISQKVADKKVLIIEKESKLSNDRTWCFWTKESTSFDTIVYKRWDKIRFKNQTQEKTFDIRPYQYQMIRGIDFYNFVLEMISKCDHIKVVKDQVKSYQEEKEHVNVVTSRNEYHADLFFNSIPPPPPDPIRKKNNFLLQHFKGYVIRTLDNSFGEQCPHFMDFSVDQRGETRFGYVLPFSQKEALVEFTIFSEDLLDDPEYHQLLNSYITNHLKIRQYEIIENEFGAIPMTDIRFKKSENKRIFNIGYRSGMTKGSSGYTFLNIQKECHQIVNCLRENKPVTPIPPNRKFKFFDSVLLHVLAKNLLPADQVFSKLFFKNDINLIFRFLDEETGFTEDLKILASLPAFPFLKGAYFSLFSRGTKKNQALHSMKEKVKR